MQQTPFPSSTVHIHPRGTASSELNPDLRVSLGRHLSVILHLDVTEIGAAETAACLPSEEQLSSQQITRCRADRRFHR